MEKVNLSLRHVVFVIACVCTNHVCGIVATRRRERQERKAGGEKGKTPLEHDKYFRAKPEKETEQFPSIYVPVKRIIIPPAENIHII